MNKYSTTRIWVEWPMSLGWCGEALVIRKMQNRTSKREHLTPTAKVIIKRLNFPSISEDVNQCDLSPSSRRSWRWFNHIRLLFCGILTGQPNNLSHLGINQKEVCTVPMKYLCPLLLHHYLQQPWYGIQLWCPLVNGGWSKCAYTQWLISQLWNRMSGGWEMAQNL